jgi:hypothetical protein
VWTADAAKNGLYVTAATAITSTVPRGGLRHFMSLQELTSSSYVTAMAVDKDDRVIVGTSSGHVHVLQLQEANDN